MSRFLGRYSSVVFALMRIVVGLLLACHGGQKVFGMFPSPDHTAHPFDPASMQGVAGIIELVGGFLVALGLFGDWAAFLCSGLMAVAYFMVHFTLKPPAVPLPGIPVSTLGIPNGFFPIMNHGEPAVLYCWIFLYIAFHGSGILSLDHLLFRRQTATESAATI